MKKKRSITHCRRWLTVDTTLSVIDQYAFSLAGKRGDVCPVGT